MHFILYPILIIAAAIHSVIVLSISPATSVRCITASFLRSANSRKPFSPATPSERVLERSICSGRSTENTINRQLAAKHRKIFWDLNPDNPRAKIYTDYIDKYAEQNKKCELLGGYNYEHFTIFDNINIPESSKRIFISQYDAQTIWYKRDILGMRCIAEGLIFRKFADVPEQFITDEKAKNIRFISIGIDFGGNGSKTTFVATAMIGKFESIHIIADYKLSGGKGTIDPDKINRELLAFYQYVKQE
ncbi:MAG: hypothetical protein ACI4JF_10420 [Oscillospiraceae bacterium]